MLDYQKISKYNLTPIGRCRVRCRKINPPNNESKDYISTIWSRKWNPIMQLPNMHTHMHAHIHTCNNNIFCLLLLNLFFCYFHSSSHSLFLITLNKLLEFCIDKTYIALRILTWTYIYGVEFAGLTSRS